MTWIKAELPLWHGLFSTNNSIHCAVFVVVSYEAYYFTLTIKSNIYNDFVYLYRILQVSDMASLPIVSGANIKELKSGIGGYIVWIKKNIYKILTKYIMFLHNKNNT